MTDLTGNEGEVLKVDCLGRVRTPPERREALLAEFEKSEKSEKSGMSGMSGMSGKAFAEHYGINYQTFYWWHRQQRRRKNRKRTKRVEEPENAKSKDSKESASFALAVAELPEPTVSAGRALEVELPGDVRI